MTGQHYDRYSDTPRHIPLIRASRVEELETNNPARPEWSMEVRQTNPGPFAARTACSDQPEGISLSWQRIDSPVQMVAKSSARTIDLVIPVHSNARSKACGRELTRADMLVFGPAATYETITDREAGENGIHLGVDLFRNLARTQFPSLQHHLSPEVTVLRGDRQRLSNICRRHVQRMSEPGCGSAPLSNYLAEVISWMVEASVRIADDERMSVVTARQVTKRCRDYIEEHLDEVITVDALCRHANTGSRTIQRSFMSHYGLSPVRFIRMCRLNAAHRLLIAANPYQGSVTSIALDCGCRHLGRFSVQYREHFGELPRETLARWVEGPARTRRRQRRPSTVGI